MSKEQADAAFREGAFEKAIDLYADALVALPASDVDQRPILLVNRSAALLKVGRAAHAAADAEQATLMSPNAIKAFYRLACARRELGAWREALEACEAGLAIAPHAQLSALANTCKAALGSHTPTSASTDAQTPRSAADATAASATADGAPAAESATVPPPSCKRPKLSAAPAEADASASAEADEWTGMALPPYACPPKPAMPAGLDALQKLALSASPPPSKIFLSTRDLLVAYDVYPKARVHLLILPRVRLDGPNNLTAAHAPLVRSMARLADWLAAEMRRRDPALAPLVAGFHSVPSMRQCVAPTKQRRACAACAACAACIAPLPRSHAAALPPPSPALRSRLWSISRRPGCIST